MKPQNHYLLRLFILINLLLLCLPWPASSDEHCNEWVGKAVSIQGDVQIRKEGDIDWQVLKTNAVFCSGDMIRALARSRAGVVLKNGSTIRLDQNSTLTFEGIAKENTFLLKLLKGAAHIFSRVPRKMKIATPFVNGAVEGTEFLVRVEPAQTTMTVFEGRLLASNDAGAFRVLAGQSVITEEGKAP